MALYWSSMGVGDVGIRILLAMAGRGAGSQLAGSVVGTAGDIAGEVHRPGTAADDLAFVRRPGIVIFVGEVAAAGERVADPNKPAGRNPEFAEPSEARVAHVLLLAGRQATVLGLLAAMSGLRRRCVPSSHQLRVAPHE